MSDVKIRNIVESDIDNGFLESLDSLRKTSNLDREIVKDILRKIIANPDHIIQVAEIDGKIVGSTTLLIEQKFIHDGGRVGHIEDVVVSKEYEGRGIGIKLVSSLLEKAKMMNCYKTILDCQDELIPFYERIGFKQESKQMRYNH
ncbi:MAG: GNAT family N-acetyltransferase [Crenarchaeota archaeon]|nr:GNAT family N-acetyltransferase [Thermoproteota archaeon]MDA1124518.1 GNAT family N-acetyltransferase [Thermoproteota archaeon]